jgi:hypothetical protein
VLKNSYGFRADYILAEQGGNLSGLLPLMEADNWPKGRRGISLPFTDECGPLANEPGVRKELTEAALDEGRRRGWKHLELRGCSECLPDARPSLSFYGHHLGLERGEKGIFERFESSVQRAIRKATKEGVRVEIASGLEAVEMFFRLHCKTRRKHGLPPQSFDFLKAFIGRSSTRARVSWQSPG